MAICMRVVGLMSILNPRTMKIYKTLRGMDGEDLRECHNLNIMLSNCRTVTVCSPLFSTRVGCVKNTASMVGFVLNPIVFNGHGLINQSYAQNVTMGFRMR